MLIIDWKPSARADATEIVNFISVHNKQAAERLYESIRHDLEHAAEHPYLFKLSTRIASMREIVTHPNYIIFYRVTSNSIEVVRIVHTRRQFPVQTKPGLPG